jgi:catechol 2,3-dioxygenase-like lactoylglutathione lyase family enzyme
MEPPTATTPHHHPPFQSSTDLLSKPTCLPVARINHITRVVRDLTTSIAFYSTVLGFVQIKRPGKLEEENDGAWLFRDGMAIHLIQGSPVPRSSEINISADHISFQPSGTLMEIENCLQSHGIVYKMQYVSEGGFTVPQVFFHDPDNNMIEICPCDCLPICPLVNTTTSDDGATGHSPTESSEMSEGSAHHMSHVYSYSE